jgi:hypothetical protein
MEIVGLSKFQNCGCFCEECKYKKINRSNKDCIQEALNPLGVAVVIEN